MLRTLLHTRRRNRYAPHICAITSALLLLFSLSLLHTRLSRHQLINSTTTSTTSSDDPFSFSDDSLLQDSDSDLRFIDDRIDELDIADDDSKASDEEEILRGLDSEGEDANSNASGSSGFYFDHVEGVIRRALDRRLIDEIDRWESYSSGFGSGFFASVDDRGKVAFGSDDVPVDEDVRRKMIQVRGIEDLLLLKSGSGSGASPLREGWGPWFDAKSDFLRKDRMFKSNLEMLNPLHNPLLQDPDGFGVTGLTRGDKLVLKGLLYEMKRTPFLGKKPLGFKDVDSKEAGSDQSVKSGESVNETNLSTVDAVVEDKQVHLADQHIGMKRNDRRTLDNGDKDATNTLETVKFASNNDESLKAKESNLEYKMGEADSQKVVESTAQSKSESSVPMYAGRGRWGHFPGLDLYLSFSEFMDSFFGQSKCSLRVFMVWNSPPWMYTVRYQRGLESLLFHHPNACVVVFSETLDLDFFKDFQIDGFKVAVAMPNLEELLKDTPTEIFVSVWHEWRTTRFYSTHYSELIRLAALYKYGGIYLDCDVIVLKPLSSLTNTVGAVELLPKSPLNGALMAFKKGSSFIMDCLSEFYSTYDDTLLRWNGADLLSRVAGNFSGKGDRQLEISVHPSHIFFPVGSHDIKKYFNAPVTESEKAHQDALFRKILIESYTFHFWNSITSTLIPEPGSLVARFINHHCIRCSDVL